MNIRVLAFEGCPNDQPTISLIEEILRENGIRASVERVEVTSETAGRLRFLGSPTVQIDGIDIDPSARNRTRFGMSCRTYPGSGGVPPRKMIQEAIMEAV